MNESRHHQRGALTERQVDHDVVRTEVRVDVALVVHEQRLGRTLPQRLAVSHRRIYAPRARHRARDRARRKVRDRGLTQASVFTVAPAVLTSAGTVGSFRDQNQTLMKVDVRSIA